MTTATLTPLPTLPPRPLQPLRLRNLIEIHNLHVRAQTRALTNRDLTHYTALGVKVAAARAAIQSWIQTPEGITHEAEVAAYNRAVDERNAAAARNHQARLNAREVSAVRSAACPRCFTTHAGEC